MGLKLLYSNTFRGSFDSLTKILKVNIHSQYNNIVIVPDRFSLTIEKAILDKLGIAGSINIQVVSFSRLADLVLGNRINKCLSPESAVMLMSKVIRDNIEKLQCYHNVGDIALFAHDMYAAISEIRNNSISVDNLRQARERISNQGVDKKTNDIILLYDKYINELKDNYNDTTTRLERLRDEIVSSEYIINSHIYITDFYLFKHTEYDIIEQMMRYCRSVNIALIRSIHNASNMRIYPNYKVVNIAKNLGVDINESFNPYLLDRINTQIEKRLFSYDNGNKIDCNNRIKLYHSPDIEGEITNAARGIKDLVRDGLRYMDIAIVTSDIATYTPYIESIFKRFNIPYFIDCKEALANHPLIRFLFNIYDYINDNFSTQYAYEIVKNPFANIDYKDADIFENHCIKYGIKGRQVFNSFSSEDSAVAESVRSKLCEIVKAFNPDSLANVNEYIDKSFNLLKSVNADAVLDRLAEAQITLGDKASAEVTKQIPLRLKDLFLQIREMIGDNAVSYDEYITLSKASIGSAKISMIPQYIDCVFIGEPLESRYALIKALYIVGANDNVMPIVRKERGIITQYECKQWGVELHPTPKHAMNIDKLHLHQLLIKPERLLSVSYCSRSQDGEFLSPSSIIKQLNNIFDVEVVNVSDLYKDNYELSDELRAKLYGSYFGTYNNAASEAVKQLRAFRESSVNNYDMLPYDAVYSLMDNEIKSNIMEINNLYKDTLPYIDNPETLFFNKYLSTSVSQLECFMACPFKHFARYGLKVREREEDKLEAVDKGLIIHSALEFFIKKIKEINPEFDITNKQKEQLINDTIAHITGDKDYKLIIDNNDRDILVDSIVRTLSYVLDIINASKFKPYLVEAGFGEIREFKPIIIEYGEGRIVKLSGKVDRVDRLDDKIIIVDYKTGNVKDDINRQLYYGLKIQLFIYLKALTAQGNKPAGVLYMHLSDDFKTNKDNDCAYKGKIIKDYAQDLDPYIYSGSNKILNVKVKDNDIKGKDIVTEYQLDEMLSYSTSISKQAVIEISDGYIEAKPYSGSCNYCEYEDICYARLSKPTERKGASTRDILFGRGQADE